MQEALHQIGAVSRWSEHRVRNESADVRAAILATDVVEVALLRVVLFEALLNSTFFVSSDDHARIGEMISAIAPLVPTFGDETMTAGAGGEHALMSSIGEPHGQTPANLD